MEQKESARLNKSNQLLIFIICGTLLLLLIVSTLYYAHRNRHARLMLAKELHEKELLAEKLNLQHTNTQLIEQNRELAELNSRLQAGSLRKINYDNSCESLIDDILHNYNLIVDNLGKPIRISPAISGAEVCQRIRQRTTIAPDDKIWTEIESLIRNEAPGFMNVILRLHSGSKDILHIIMLIRIGFRPSEIASLFSRTKNTISSHRSTICKSVFMGKIPTSALDDVIRSISIS